MRRTGARGFTVLEVIVAAAVTVILSATLFAMFQPTNELFARYGEAGDLQQRLRVAEDTLFEQLQEAGAGVSGGSQAGPLLYSFAPVIPHRLGGPGDVSGTFADDVVSIVYVPRSGVHAALALPLAARSGTAILDVDSCSSSTTCGFTGGMNVLVYDSSGSYSLFTVVSAQAGLLELRHDAADSATVYASGSTIAEIEAMSYFVGIDQAANVGRLMRASGDGRRQVPLVDHVVSLRVEYLADPDPPTLLKSISEPNGPWTTYGPAPPDLDVQQTEYPAGENCVFVNDGGPLQSPRLPAWSAPAGTLVRLTGSQAIDGPWCPDHLSPTRFDADLLRVRAVDVTIRLESALPSLRGPAGSLFFNAGTSRGGAAILPDIEARFRVSPRNLSIED